MAIVPLEGKIEIPLQVERLLDCFYPYLGKERKARYALIFRIGVLFGKRIEPWKKFDEYSKIIYDHLSGSGMIEVTSKDQDIKKLAQQIMEKLCEANALKD
jgi:hypothetical protein